MRQYVANTDDGEDSGTDEYDGRCGTGENLLPDGHANALGRSRYFWLIANDDKWGVIGGFFLGG